MGNNVRTDILAKNHGKRGICSIIQQKKWSSMTQQTELYEAANGARFSSKMSSILEQNELNSRAR